MDAHEQREKQREGTCARCGHVHRGETRETSHAQCGYPWSEGRSFGWCQCWSRPGQVLEDGRIWRPEGCTCPDTEIEWLASESVRLSGGVVKECRVCRALD